MITFYAKRAMRILTITPAALAILTGAAHADDATEWHAYAAPLCAASEDLLRAMPALTHDGESKIVAKLRTGTPHSLEQRHGARRAGRHR